MSWAKRSFCKICRGCLERGPRLQRKAPSAGCVEDVSRETLVFVLFEDVSSGGLVVVSVRFASVRNRPLIGLSRFGIESDLEFELVERPVRFDCSQLWANHARGQLELNIQISSDRVGVPRIA